MGQKSVKDNKSIYQLSRESMELTREAASEIMGWVSASKIEKIENGKQLADPSTVLAMAMCYQDASLCNYYCSHECEIGQKYVPRVETKDLSKLTLEILANINKLSNSKDRLIEITVDGIISPDEIKDFVSIKENLDQMLLTINALKLWIDNTIAEGKLEAKHFQ